MDVYDKSDNHINLISNIDNIKTMKYTKDKTIGMILSITKNNL